MVRVISIRVESHFARGNVVNFKQVQCTCFFLDYKIDCASLLIEQKLKKMSNIKCHPVKIENTPESNYELGKALSHLRYDQIVEIFAGFMDETKEQEKKDRAVGRDRLADMLSVAATQAENVGLHFAIITDYCHLHLVHEYDVCPKSKIAEDWAIKMTE